MTTDKQIKATVDTFSNILNNRRAIKIFDESASVSDEVIAQGIEHAVLAPTSLNLQHWEFYTIDSDGAKAKMRKLCLDQKPTNSASAFVVVVARPDLVVSRSPKILQGMLESANNKQSENLAYVKKMYTKIIPAIHRPIPLFLFRIISSLQHMFKIGMVSGTMKSRMIEAHSSCAMAGNNFMLSMSAQGYDTCPIMGIDKPRVKKLLKLGRGADINMVIAIGKKVDDRSTYGDRTRLPMEDVVISV